MNNRGSRFGPGAEFDLITRLHDFDSSLPPGVSLGPGDDAAVLELVEELEEQRSATKRKGARGRHEEGVSRSFGRAKGDKGFGRASVCSTC